MDTDVETGQYDTGGGGCSISELGNVSQYITLLLDGLEGRHEISFNSNTMETKWKLFILEYEFITVDWGFLNHP